MPRLPKLRLAVVIALVFLPALYAQADPLIGPCQVFPLDNPWNMDVSNAPVDPNSANYIANINANQPNRTKVHPDFGENPEYGIPFETVDGSVQPDVPINYDPEGYEDESDPGPYPIPGNARVEGTDSSDGDRHVLVIDTDSCILYELYNAYPNTRPATSWTVYSSAIWDLNSPIVQQRPLGWTSADAAGLPIFPGLARCDEANSGTIKHAFRFTVNRTQRAYIYPASHFASTQTGANYPPMGLRFRLKANYDLSSFTGQALAIANALKKYGMMIADNGSNWYISGETNPGCWDDNNLNQLKNIPGTAFEVVSIISAPTASPVKHYYTTTTALLTWSRHTLATGYELQVDDEPSFALPRIYENSAIPASELSDDVSVPGNDTYYWRVRAVGSPAWSATESFIVNAP